MNCAAIYYGLTSAESPLEEDVAFVGNVYETLRSFKVDNGKMAEEDQ